MEIGIVRPVRIEEEMKGAYLDYAMSVITARALPDVRDGLKPVQRRILYAMDELGLRHTAAYKKSARIVGEVMGKYHPHGDAPVYETMVRMAQDFSMRYPLVDGQGNFGSVDGDPPAAMRYTEARLAAIAEEMLADIDKNTVDFAANFDDTLKQPGVLPSKLPNLLVNGSAGIAVGMATNIPPHNLTEVVEALTYVVGRFGEALDAGVPFNLVWGRAFNAPVDLALATKALSALRGPLKERVDAAATKLARRPDSEQRVQSLLQVVDDLIDVPPDKLMEMIKGPDFPTAGIILGGDGIKNAYATGHGRITIRARAHTEDMRGGRTQIVITELPFQVNKATLLEKIAELVRERRVEGISELRDESDRQGMRIVIELRREAQPKQILNQLYKYTAMQTAFSVNMLALVDGQPRVLTLKMVLLHYLNHRREVITRRTEFDLQRARHRAHILEGLKIALEHLDEVISTIRRSKDAETARVALMRNFKLSEIQAQAILDMQLRRLAALERQKILDEYAETLKLIASLEDLLAHPAKILYLIRDELLELKSKYGDDRRTRIMAEEVVEFTEEDLIPDQEVVVSISAKGYVRRVLADNHRLQRRGTKGLIGTVAKEDDPPTMLFSAGTRDSLLLFSNRGRAYQMKVYDVPDVSRQARGLPIGNFVSMEDQERVVAALPLSKLEGRHVVLATRRGEVKRVAASEYAGARAAGIIGVAVPEGDELLGAVATSGRQEVVLVTADGQAIRFAESELRPSGRSSGGVRGIRLGDNDRLVAIEVARSGGQLVVATRRGFAKRTPLAEFSTQGRGGGGIRAANVTIKNGELVAARVAGEGDELVVVAGSGTVLRTPVAAVEAMGRSAQGAPIITLDRDDKVIAAMVIPAPEKTPGDRKPGQPKDEEPGMPNEVETGETPKGKRTRGGAASAEKRPAPKAGGAGAKAAQKAAPVARVKPAKTAAVAPAAAKDAMVPGDSVTATEAALKGKDRQAVADGREPLRPSAGSAGAKAPSGAAKRGGKVAVGSKAAPKGGAKPAPSPKPPVATKAEAPRSSRRTGMSQPKASPKEASDTRGGEAKGAGQETVADEAKSAAAANWRPAPGMPAQATGEGSAGQPAAARGKSPSATGKPAAGEAEKRTQKRGERKGTPKAKSKGGTSPTLFGSIAATLADGAKAATTRAPAASKAGKTASAKGKAAGAEEPKRPGRKEQRPGASQPGLPM